MRKNPHLQLQDLTAKSLSDDDDVQDQPGQGKKKFPYWYIFAALSLLYAFCDKVKHLELNTGERRNQI